MELTHSVDDDYVITRVALKLYRAFGAGALHVRYHTKLRHDFFVLNVQVHLRGRQTQTYYLGKATKHNSLLKNRAMKFEDPELVWTRLCLLVMIFIFGVFGNSLAILLNARSFHQNRLNGIAYLHLACVDLLICCTHVPIGIYLESCGFFSLYNDVSERYGILWFLNKQISLRVFFVSSFASYVTLGAIAYLRCWVIFNPFGRPAKSRFVAFLLMSDVVIIALNSVTPIPGMSFVTPDNNNSTHNSTSNDTNSIFLPNNMTEKLLSTTLHPKHSLTVPNNTVLETMVNSSDNSNSDDGKTVVGDHGVSVPLLIYTMVVTLLMVTVCYTLICYKLQKAFRELKSDKGSNGMQNVAAKAFLKRQVRHLKTHAILVVTLMVTVMPTVVIAVGGFEISYALQRLRSTIVVASSAINPYVYCLLKASSRKAIYETISYTRRTAKTEEIRMNTVSESLSLSP